MKDMIYNPDLSPTFKDISDFIAGPVRNYWVELNSFIQAEFKASPKIQFSKCSAQPGWNIKYQKSGKAICTLYPEHDQLTVLVVIPLELAEIIKTSLRQDFSPRLLEVIRTAKPFNGTKWLMINISDLEMLENVKRLLDVKHKMNCKRKPVK